MPEGGNNATETVIRDKQSKEILGDNVLNAQELNAITTLKTALDGKINARDTVGKANEMNTIINKYFSFYDKKIDTKTNTFSETKKEEGKNRVEIKNKVDVFYGNLLTDLRTKYESMSYEKDGEKNVNTVLELASFYINLYAWDDAKNYVRSDINIQQTEEKFKWIMRKGNPESKPIIQTITSKNPNMPVWFHLKETQTNMIDGPVQSLDNRYDLDPAMIGDKATIEKSFEGIKNILNKENIKINSVNIVWLSSKTDYVYGKQEAKIGNETLVVTDNQTLANARGKIAENRFKTNFGDKFVAWYTSNITYQPEVGPEYKKWTDDAKDPKYREFQWIRFEVKYTEPKPENTYIFEKDMAISAPEWYNKRPATEVLIHNPDNTEKKSEYSDLFVSWWLLNSPNGVASSNQNKLIRWNKIDEMFTRIYQEGKEGPQPSIVSRWYEQYKAFSEENPSQYPKITDPQKDLSRVDQLDWINKMDYWKWEITSKTPILNLDVNNSVHKWILEDMKSKWVVIEKNGQYIMPPNKTDKYISEYMSKRTKIYVKDAITNGKRTYAA